MKPLRESILSTGFDVRDEDTAALALAESLSRSTSEAQKRDIKVEVTLNGDKYDIKPDHGQYVCVMCDEFAQIMKGSPIKHVVFWSEMDTRFENIRPVVFEGLDISAPIMSFDISNNMTFKDCVLRNAPGSDITFSSANKSCKFTLINTIVYAGACEIYHSDVEVKGFKSQINLEYECYIYKPTKAQINWLEKHNIPVTPYEIGRVPDLWTDPNTIITGNAKEITDYFVIKGDKYTYKFYGASPETPQGVLATHYLNNGWILYIHSSGR